MNIERTTRLSMAFMAAGLVAACAGNLDTTYTPDGKVDVAACERAGGEVKLQGSGHFSGAQFPQCVEKGSAARVN
jgi:hypothetical protein